MPRAATGTVWWNRGVPFAKVMLDTRVNLKLATCRTPEEAERRKDVLADLAKRLRAAGCVGDDGKRILQRAADATESALPNLVAAVGRIAEGSATFAKPTKPTTIGDVAKMWTSGELAERFPAHIKKKRSAESDEHRLKHVLPVVGDVPVTAFGVEHGDRVLAMLPAMSQASRRHVAQVIHRVLALAVYPLRLIPASPLPKGWLPKLGPKKAKAYLYPDEDAQLLACEEIPIVWRLLYGFLHREGMRRAEALTLQWHDVDLVRGAVALDRNKTDEPRAWALRPDVIEALCAWYKRRDSPAPDAHVFVDDSGHPLTDDHTADRYRADLERAGVARKQLFERSAARRPIRMHDTRATFVTIALANGKTEAWVKMRTGHKSSDQIATYQRAAQMVTELSLGDLAPLATSLPGLIVTEASTGARSGMRQDVPQGIQVPAGLLPWGFKSPSSHRKTSGSGDETGPVTAPGDDSGDASDDSSAGRFAVALGWWEQADRWVANDLLAGDEVAS